MTIVLVDARNVLRSRWPNVPEDEIVARTCAWAAEEGMRAVVAFDGRAPGSIVGESEGDGSCVVVGTGGESADDWLTRRASELERDGMEYWLVTSDRELRTRAGGAAARTVGGGAFLGLLGLR